MIRPNFFIVGAPKAGTTALYTFLRQHPEVYMPKRKEMHFFGSDIHSRHFVRDHRQYLASFSGASDHKRVGEASVWYLYSRNAAKEIKSFSPSAMILIMLRNPVDMLYSLHSQFLYNGSENIEDFEAALNAEEYRKQGLHVPPAVHFVECLFYRETAKYADQVKRYFDAFGKEHVHIIIYDDFKKDPRRTYRETLSFLGVDDMFEPDVRIVNPNKTVRSVALHNFLINPPDQAPPLLGALVPRFIRANVRKMLKRINTKYEPRRPMNAALRSHLLTEFVPEVVKLSELIGRDLSEWGRE